MRGVLTCGGLVVIASLLLAAPALAHHPFGGEAPKNILQGLLSGLGHPVIGLDHLAFVIAVGLLAAVLRRGMLVPIVFLLATVAGTGLHLAELTLPAPELVISASVLLFGLLAVTCRPLNTPAVMALAAIAGIFHGYAYGEAIIGAEPMPIAAYLAGFTGIQGAIAYATWLVMNRIFLANRKTGFTVARSAGLALCGIGVVFVGSLLL